jgi:hypothetical protein
MSPALATSEAEYVQKRIEALQAVVDEPVLGVLAMSRRGHYTQMLLGKLRLGFVPYLLAKIYAKKQAGGLPENFMVAITPTKLRAFQYKARGRMRDRYEIGDEVAHWDRDAVVVTWQPGPPYQIDVTLESPGEGERVLCRCGRAASSEQALQLMAERGGAVNGSGAE